MTLRARLTRVVPASALAILALAVLAGPAAAKKQSSSVTVEASKQVDQAIPPATSPTSWGLFTSTIDIGNRYAKKRIRDLNVTLQGTANTQGAPGGLYTTITSPSGGIQTVIFGITGTAWGPVTIDDESPFLIGFSAPPCPQLYLCEPYKGSAKGGDGETPLALLDNGKVRGTWTLTIYNQNNSPTAVNNLVSWGITVVAGKPYALKN